MNIRSFVLAAAITSAFTSLNAENLPPIACNMKNLSAEQRKQLKSVGGKMVDAVTDSRELRDGYAFRMDPAHATITNVAEWLDLWRKCCPFYEFRIDYHAADATIWLSVTGRPGVKEYFPLDAPTLAAKLAKSPNSKSR